MKVGYIGGERRPDRDNLVFIHSAGGTGRLWEAEVEYFSKWFNTIAPDLPGRSGSGGVGRKDAFEYADFIKGVMDRSGFSPAVVIGLSLGGAIAQALALLYPDDVLGLVLSGTGAKMPVSQIVFDGIKGDYSKFLELIGGFAYGPDTPDEIITRHRKVFGSVVPEVASGDFVACSRFDSRERLKEIDVPTLVLCGDKDNMMPMKFSAYLNEQIKDSRLEVFPGVGHFVMSEATDRFREVVSRFLDEIRG